MKKRDLLLNIILFVVTVWLITILLKYSIFSRDDFYHAFFDRNETFFSWFQAADQGRYLSDLLMKFFCHIVPLLLNVHPQDNFLLPIVKGIGFATMAYVFSYLALLGTPKKFFSVNPLIYLLSTLMLAIIIANNPWDLFNNTMFFVYFFNFIFALLGIITVSKYFLNDYVPNKSDIIRNTLIAFIVGASGHIVFIPILCFCFFIIAYALLTKRLNIKNAFKNPAFNLPSIFLILGGILSFSNANSIYFFNRRVESESVVLKDISYNLKDFIPAFIENVFIYHRHLELFIIIIFTILLAIFLGREREKTDKYIVLSLAIIFGIASFNFALIFCGSNTFYQPNTYWVAHNEIQQVTSLYFLAAFFILLNCLLKYKNIYNILFLFIAILVGEFYVCSQTTIKRYYDASKVDRKYMYQMEKIFVYNVLNHNLNIYFPKLRLVEDGTKEIAVDRFLYLHKIKVKNMNEIKIYFVSEKEFHQKLAQSHIRYTNDEYKDLRFTKLLDKKFILSSK